MLKDVVEKGGVLTTDGVAGKGKVLPSDLSGSATTVYHNLISQIQDTGEVDDEVTSNFKNARIDRQSSSSDKIDTSDDMMNIDCDQFIAECRDLAKNGSHERELDNNINPYERGEERPKDADRKKDKLEATPGRQRVHEFLGINRTPLEQNANKVTLGSSAQLFQNVDEEYMSIGGHVDALLQERIVNFEYIDFGKIIPRDKITKIEDQRMELVVCGGADLFCTSC